MASADSRSSNLSTLPTCSRMILIRPMPPPSVQVLINAGASPQARDKDGDTPLHEVVRCFKAEQSGQYIAAAQALLDGGASASTANDQGITPISSAAQKGVSQLEAVLRNQRQGGHPPPPIPNPVEEWEIRYSDLRLLKALGEGGFGQVGCSACSVACPVSNKHVVPAFLTRMGT